MKKLNLIHVVVVCSVLLCIKPVSGERLSDGNGLQDTQWDVYVMQLPKCLNECGGALVSFNEEGSGDIKWDDPSIEGLPFSYAVRRAFDTTLFFTVNDSMPGGGIASISKGILMVLFNCSLGYCGPHYVMVGVPHINSALVD